MTIKVGKKRQSQSAIILKPLKDSFWIFIGLLIFFAFAYIINFNMALSAGFEISKYQELLKTKTLENKNLIQQITIELAKMNIDDLAKELNLVPSENISYLKESPKGPLSLLPNDSSFDF